MQQSNIHMRYVQLQKSQSINRHRPKNYTVIVIVLLCIVLISVSILLITIQNSKAKPVPVQSLSSSTIRTMGNVIQKTIQDNTEIKTSVSIFDLKSGGSYHYGSHDVFVGASVNKLITATLLLDTIDKKKNSVYTMIDGQRASPLLTKMIEDSNNDAWTSINHYLTADALRSWASQNGWGSYNYDTNEITADDIAKLVAALYQGRLVSESSKNILLGHMHNANEENLIVESVPKGELVYHKAGWLDNNLNDAAIIDNGNRPFVLVIFCEGDDIFASHSADSIFSGITAAAVKAFSAN